MLCELIIENVAVIEKAHINFKDGFTCLTGETGAGKSIIIDSINAITGDRLSKNIVRTGAEKASIVAVFENLDQSIVDDAARMDIDISEECIVSRQITKDGKSTSRINSVPYPASVLKALFSRAINTHGQHDNQNLLNSSNHIDILDSFGTDLAIKNNYRRLYGQYTELNRQISELEELDRTKQNSLDLLTYQVEEIESATLSASEEEELNDRKKIIKNAESILDALTTSYDMLFGDESEMGAVSALQQASSRLEKAGNFSSRINDIYSRVNEAVEAARSAGYDLKNFIDDFDVDVGEIDRIEERLDVYYRLKHKYGPEVENVLEYYEKSKSELEKIEFAREKLEKLYEEMDIISEKLAISADRLTENRKAVFDFMAARVSESLAFLNMPFVRLSLSCKKKNYSENGQDDIEFLISANKGEEPKPLSRIASGGELSRIMLAMKNVLAEKDRTHTLIFDEIDSGVSGDTALKIGKLMKVTSAGKQVLCVTHSAQIASFADNHMLIEKTVDKDSTFTSVRELTENERVLEIARIISGENITDIALRNAREMIFNAKNG